MTTTEQNGSNVPAKSATKTLGDILTSRQDELRKLAGSLLSPERLIRLAVLAHSGSPYLQKCSPSSVIRAVLDAARLGLEPDGVHGALVPMNTKSGWEASFWPMYKGLCARAYDDESVQSIQAVAVRDGEVFHVERGTRDSIEHRPSADCAENEAIAYYAIVKMRGTVMFDVMYRSEVERIMKRSPAASRGFSPWSSDFDEMAKKTVLKRCLKTAPIRSVRLSQSIAADDDATTIDVVSEDETATEAPKKPSKTSAMKASLAARNESTEMVDPRVDDEMEPAPSARISDEKKAKILNLLDKAGARDAGARSKIVGAVLERDVPVIADLTEGEADRVIAGLSGSRP